MMLPRAAWLAPLVSCCSLLAGPAQLAASPAAGGAPPRAWRSSVLRVSPAPDDLVLVEVRYSGTTGRRKISEDLVATAAGPLGNDYVVIATASLDASGSPRALVLIVNRPSALLDPRSVLLALKSSPALGTAVLSTRQDPLTRPSGKTPSLCDLTRRGGPALRAAALRPLRSYGLKLAGFDRAGAVAQAYDLVCGLAHESSFVEAVRHGGVGVCRPLGALCCPPNAICAPSPPTPAPPLPTPAPPTPAPPGCPPCDPAPGHACPLAVPRACAAELAGGAGRAAPAPH